MNIPFIDINSGEFIIIVIIALVLIGPKRLPGYVEKLRTFIRTARDMAEGAKTQLKTEMGPEFQDVDWRQYDPRQYDPRKIVREALFDDPDADLATEIGLRERTANSTGATAAGAAGAAGAAAYSSGNGADGATGVGAEGIGAEGVGGEDAYGVPAAPRSHVTAEYHPDRVTPFDDDAT